MEGGVRRSVSSVICGLLTVLLCLGMPYTQLLAAEAQPVDNQLTKSLIEEGITAYQQGRYDEAVTKLTQARTLLPTHSPTALYLGLTYLRQGNNAEAIATWQDYITLQPWTEAEKKANLPYIIVPGYLTLLIREENRRVAREAVLLEQQLGAGDPQTVAITYYRMVLAAYKLNSANDR